MMELESLSVEDLVESGLLEKLDNAPFERESDQSITRRSFTLPQKWADALDELARKKNLSVSKAILRAIETQIFLETIEAEGGQTIVQDHDGNFYRFTP
ncbi:MAG: ribbon-helix-helix protein, CopG family [Cyanobacteria bacterium J06555_13]